MWIRVFLVLILGLVILSTGDAYANSIKVMSLNVLADEYTDAPSGTPADSYGKLLKWSDRVNLVRNIVSQAKPDVFGLQEDSKKQCMEIAASIQNQYQYSTFEDQQSETYGREASLGTIFYKPSIFQLIKSGTFFIGGARNATWVVLSDKNTQTEWLFINVHLYGGNGNTQLAKIESFIKKNQGDRKVVLLGDFNNGTEHLKTFTNNMSLAANSEDRRVVFANDTLHKKSSVYLNGAKAIDHIIYAEKDELSVKEVTTWYSKSTKESAKAIRYPYQSDHGAVMLEIKMKLSKKEITKRMAPIISYLLED